MINPKGKRKSSYIRSRDINGNIIYLDPITGKEVSRGIEQGTTQQVSYPIKKQQMINQDVQKKHNERIKSGQSVMIRGKEVRVTPNRTQVYQSTDERPQSMKDVSKQSYEQDYKQQQLDKAVNQTTTALGNFSNYFLPSTYAGALVDKLEGKNSFSGSLIEGNNGLGSVGANLVFDLASPLVLGKGFSLMTTLGKQVRPILNKTVSTIGNYRYPLGRPQIPKNFITIKPQVRTRVGDVEINDPNLLYHLDRGNGVGAFSNQGAYVENGVLFPGVAKKEGQLGYSWWNEEKPYATSINGQPMTRLMTATKDTPGMLQVRSQNYPIGQWTGSKGFVLPSEYVNSERVNVSGSLYNWRPGYGYKKIAQEPSTSLAFFERKPSKISEAERAGVPKGERNIKQGYLLKDAIEEANNFAEKWGYDKLSQNATLQDIENLYNQHNTFFRGVTTEQLENTRNRVAKELGVNPEQLTNDQYLQYVSTHPWPGNDRIWVTPFSHYGKMYGNSDMIGGKGQVSAVMRTWKTTKDIKQWPKLSQWTLGFKEDVSNPVITPWVSNAPDAIRSLGAQSEFLVKPPLIYRGLGKDFGGTLQQYLKYNDNQGKLGWIESQVGELPQEIIIEKQGGKMNTLQLLKNGSGIHIKKENKGLFTDYCGGKVTSECIAKGKRSSNPAVRKRATFAANVRKWKHKEGGKAFVKGVNILDSNPDAYKYVKKKLRSAQQGAKIGFGQKIGNFLNSDTGKSIVNLGQQLYSGISDASNKIKQNEKLQKWKQSFINSQSLSDAERQNFYIQSIQNQQMNNPDGNVSDIVASHDAWKLEQQELQKRKKEAEMQANQYITQMSLINNNQQTGGNGFDLSGMANSIFDIFGNSKLGGLFSQNVSPTNTALVNSASQTAGGTLGKGIGSIASKYATK